MDVINRFSDRIGRFDNRALGWIFFVFLISVMPIGFAYSIYVFNRHEFFPTLIGFIAACVVSLIFTLVLYLDSLNDRSIYWHDVFRRNHQVTFGSCVVHFVLYFFVSLNLVVQNVHDSFSDDRYEKAQAYMIGSTRLKFCSRRMHFKHYENGQSKKYCFFYGEFIDFKAYQLAYRSTYPDSRSEEDVDRQMKIWSMILSKRKIDKDPEYLRNHVYPPGVYMVFHESVFGESFFGLDLDRYPEPKPQPKSLPVGG